MSPEIAFDTETYEKYDGTEESAALIKRNKVFEGKELIKGHLYPVLDGTGRYFLCGSITNTKMKSKIFYDKKEMWDYILNMGKRARKNGKTLYAYAHNIKYDFFNIFENEKDLVVLSKFPFIAVYYTRKQEIIEKEKWKSYKTFLDKTGKRYQFKQRTDGNYDVSKMEEAVRFVDTCNIFLNKRLKDVGEMIGMEKLDLPLELKSKDDLKTMIPYVTRDTEVLIKAVQMLKEKIKKDGIRLKRIVTMNQIAISYLVKMMKQINTPIFTNDKSEKIIQSRARRRVRKAYKGGRDEVWRLGITKGVSSIDCNSLYPYAASVMRFPDLKSEVYWNKPAKRYWQELLEKTGVCRAMMYNENCKIGLLGVKLDHIGYYPKEGKYMIGTWTNKEILKAVQEGYKIIDIQFIVTYDDLENPFKKIMPELYQHRHDESLGTFNREFYKSIMNGGIGKFAQTKIGQEIVFDNKDKTEEYLKLHYKRIGGVKDDSRIMMFKKEEKRFKYKNYYCPIIPALITAEARMYMYDVYKRIGADRIVQTSTDNIAFIGDIASLPKEIEINPMKLGAFKIQYENAEVETWGRKSKRVNSEIKVSGVSKNDVRKYDEEKKVLTFVKMQGIGKDNIGAFIEQSKDLIKQSEEYLKQEEMLNKLEVIEDINILKEQYGEDESNDSSFICSRK